MIKLNKYLLINGSFSFVTALLMVILNTQIQTFMGFNNSFILPIVGLCLLVFSGIIFYTRKRKLDNKMYVNLIILLDWLWVLGSVILVGLQLFNLSDKGYTSIIILAMWIAFLAKKQKQYNYLN